MDRKINIINFNLNGEGAIASQLELRFSQDSRVNFGVIRFYKEVATFFKDSSHGILLFKIENKAELAQSIAILKSNIDSIEKGHIRAACLLGVNSPKVERLLYKYGCKDLLEFNVNPKTLLLKVEMWTRTIESLLNSQNDCFMSVGQRSQDFEKTESTQMALKTLKEADFDDEDIEEELNELVNEIEEQVELADDFDELIDELDDGEIEEDQDETLRLTTTEDSTPELVNYVKENGDSAILNLETGYLGLALEGYNGKENCVFESFDENRMVLEVGVDYEAKLEEELGVFVKFIYNKCKVEIELFGKVSDIELFEDGRKYVTMDFNLAEVERYEYFMSLYEKRQKSINEFMELAKGY